MSHSRCVGALRAWEPELCPRRRGLSGASHCPRSVLGLFTLRARWRDRQLLGCGLPSQIGRWSWGTSKVSAPLVGLLPLREQVAPSHKDQELRARASRSRSIRPTATSGAGTTGGGQWSPLARSAGLVNLNGTVVAPRPNRPWRRWHRMPPVKGVGEPAAGEPRARFDAAVGGDQAGRATTSRTAQAPPADPTSTLVFRRDTHSRTSYARGLSKT